MNPILTLIVPVYFNAPTLVQLHRLTVETFREALRPEELEILFVDDGSQDNSFDVLCQLAQEDPVRVRVVRLSRNFGSHAAILSGLNHCRGRYAAIIGADLQESPQIVLDMLEKARGDNAEVVLACREARQEGWSKVAFANFYYWIMRTFSQAKFPPGGFDCFLVERKVIDALVAMNETNTSLSAQVLWLGFRQSSVRYVKVERAAGKSRWTLRKKMGLLSDSILSFSRAPVRFMEYAGSFTALAGFLYAGLIIVRRIMGIQEIAGWASLMVVFLCISGVVLLCMGLVGEYLWRILEAARRRPAFLVAETRNMEKPLTCELVSAAPPQSSSEKAQYGS